ncbi:MAG: hypothetical protein DLM60_05875 [Pseudonocardiales bacterium]|nr:hypothetical protein [Actinomycetota bacterium]PZS21718.1 MAG: hypothetical protein DLM60_05875 [Pseudonocardiales bacterium]
MNVRLHHDLAEFTALTRPLLAADPVRHRIALTVLLLRGPEGGEDSPVLVSVRRDGGGGIRAILVGPHRRFGARFTR